jgi:hypothetical protein
MTKRHFFTGVGLALAVLVVFNLLLAWKVDSVPKLFMRRMAAMPRMDVLFLGNSLMEAGIDRAEFKAALPPGSELGNAFNAGLGWSTPVEHYLLARHAFAVHPKIPCVVYGFFDFQLTATPSDTWGELIGNRAMGYSTEPGLAAELYRPGSWLEPWRFRAIGAIPMLREHSQLWKFVELFRRELGGIGQPAEATDSFGRVADFEELSVPRQPEFDETCDAAVRSRAPLHPAIQALIRLAAEKQSRLVVVEMPMGLIHRRDGYASAAWGRYRDYLRQQLAAEGVAYVAAGNWVPDDADFRDGLHLNAPGAKLFSTRMAEVLAGEDESPY